MAPQLVDYFESLAYSGLTTRRTFSILMFLPQNVPASHSFMRTIKFLPVGEKHLMHVALHTPLTPPAASLLILKSLGSMTLPQRHPLATPHLLGTSPSRYPLSDFDREI